jgi:hypothetical protein
MRESDIEAYLRRRVKETGGIHRKCVWQGRRGAPDDFCMWPLLGRHAWVECKRPKKSATIQQAKEHTRMRNAGCIVYDCNTLELVNSFIYRLTGKQPDER